MKTMTKTISVNFVCLGNICRSPMAKVIFSKLVAERGLENNFVIDSCGVGGWHAGEGAHPATGRIVEEHGLSLDGHCARQIVQDDFEKFDYLIALDQQILSQIKSMNTTSKANLVLLRSFDPEQSGLDVLDPYYYGVKGQLEAYKIIYRCCEKLLGELAAGLAGS